MSKYEELLIFLFYVSNITFKIKNLPIFFNLTWIRNVHYWIPKADKAANTSWQGTEKILAKVKKTSRQKCHDAKLSRDRLPAASTAPILLRHSTIQDLIIVIYYNLCFLLSENAHVQPTPKLFVSVTETKRVAASTRFDSRTVARPHEAQPNRNAPGLLCSTSSLVGP